MQMIGCVGGNATDEVGKMRIRITNGYGQGHSEAYIME